MSEKRRDNRNRILREDEYQRTDGRYRFRYIDEDGKENVDTESAAGKLIKENLEYTIMIRQPDFITAEMVIKRVYNLS